MPVGDTPAITPATEEDDHSHHAFPLKTLYSRGPYRGITRAAATGRPFGIPRGALAARRTLRYAAQLSNEKDERTLDERRANNAYLRSAYKKQAEAAQKTTCDEQATISCLSEEVDANMRKLQAEAIAQHATDVLYVRAEEAKAVAEVAEQAAQVARLSEQISKSAQASHDAGVQFAEETARVARDAEAALEAAAIAMERSIHERQVQQGAAAGFDQVVATDKGIAVEELPLPPQPANLIHPPHYPDLHLPKPVHRLGELHPEHPFNFEYPQQNMHLGGAPPAGYGRRYSGYNHNPVRPNCARVCISQGPSGVGRYY